MGRPPPPPWLISGLLAPLIALVATGAPVAVLQGNRLLGSGTPDIWGHTWGLRWAADALAQGRLPFRNAPLLAPGGQDWWLVDLPVSLLMAPITWTLGPIAAWHAGIALLLALAAGGATAWLRSLELGPVAAVAGGLAATLSPFARGVVHSGVPEVLAILVLPLWALWLDRGLRGSRLAVGAATVLVFLLGLQGGYPLVPGAFVGAAVLLSRWRSHRWAAAVRAFPAVIGAAAAAAIVQGANRAIGHPAFRAGQPGPSDGAEFSLGEWSVRSMGGADLLNYLVPAPFLPAPDPLILHRHTVYVGLLALGLGLVAAWRSPKARPLVALGVLLGLVSLGGKIRVAGEAMAWIPGLESLAQLIGTAHLYRLGGLLPLLLIGAVLCAWQQRMALALVLLIALDGWLLGPLPVVLPTVANPAGEVEALLQQSPHPGAVLDLPLDREGHTSPGPRPQQAFHLAAMHGRPIASGLYRRHGPLGALPRLRALENYIVAGLGMAEDAPTRTLAIPGSPRADRGTLVARGYGWVSLDLTRVAPAQHGRLMALMSEWLGPPALATTDRAAWKLEAVD